MRLSKLLGVAGIVGVAATGTVLLRHERHRRSYTPEEVRARLQGRVAEVATADADPDLVPDWPAEVERPQRHPMEALLSTVMKIGPLRRI
ncbi:MULTISPECIES: hypothetical protein [unclassified Modestobacter]|uniref:hypothetical protein n=1 Tax=unclassified Modestobacter TaxID=2643866 RepID=UPI0022AA717D|nr:MULTISPECIES: hypothetical protein [unclassified Modestobacter]MCZ2826564.1 hypothetical protein [Modestobacter sp. VKM Ac-2981]MCZ2854944.1 hypothetical protein [Modestobacter sp. VKM Ac-2982]